VPGEVGQTYRGGGVEFGAVQADPSVLHEGGERFGGWFVDAGDDRCDAGFDTFLQAFAPQPTTAT
jgi:hypothetical protein